MLVKVTENKKRNENRSWASIIVVALLMLSKLCLSKDNEGTKFIAICSSKNTRGNLMKKARDGSIINNLWWIGEFGIE